MNMDSLAKGRRKQRRDKLDLKRKLHQDRASIEMNYMPSSSMNG
jgi:hypothetical protein